MLTFRLLYATCAKAAVGGASHRGQNEKIKVWKVETLLISSQE